MVTGLHTVDYAINFQSELCNPINLGLSSPLLLLKARGQNFPQNFSLAL